MKCGGVCTTNNCTASEKSVQRGIYYCRAKQRPFRNSFGRYNRHFVYPETTDIQIIPKFNPHFSRAAPRLKLKLAHQPRFVRVVHNNSGEYPARVFAYRRLRVPVDRSIDRQTKPRSVIRRFLAITDGLSRFIRTFRPGWTFIKEFKLADHVGI